MLRALFVLAIVLWSAIASADDKDAAARAEFAQAQKDEQAHDYAAALRHYRAVLAIDPGNWFAGSAKGRIDALSPYQGSFAELATLDAVRGVPSRANDRAALDELAQKSAAWPSGRVKREAMMFLASTWLTRVPDAERGVAMALAVARDPGAERFVRDAAWDLAWSALSTDLDRAAREIGADAPASVQKGLRRALRRRTLRRASVVAAVVGAASLLGAVVIAVRRGRTMIALRALIRPSSLIFLAAMPLLGTTIADAWEHGAGRPFALFGLALVCVHALVAASRGAFGDLRLRVRIAPALVAGACVLAAAYLVLEHAESRGITILSDVGL